MGGKAFASGPDALYTPRMPKDVYSKVKSRCVEVLRGFFDVVESPIDGPAKADFGDIDILLFGPKDPVRSREQMLENLTRALDARRVIKGKNQEVSFHLAIPWPAEELGGVTAEALDAATGPAADADEQYEQKHIQVDIKVCNDLGHLQWILFKHAHGDIWNMIGSTIRPYGLTVDEQAMWLRVPEIEKANRKRAKIHLTSDPDRILRFLGLPSPGYWEGPFGSTHALFEYVARCRMFWVPPAKPKREDEGVPSQENASTEDRLKLKSNDRRRMNLRPTFRQWIDEFYPECRQNGRFLEQETTRDDVTREAFETFGVEQEYNRRRREFLLEQQKEQVWNNVIKTAIPQPEDSSDVRALQYRGTLIRAFKRIILEDDDRYGIVGPADLKDEDGFLVIENVVDFIVRNEDVVARIAREHQHAAYIQKNSKQEKHELRYGPADP